MKMHLLAAFCLAVLISVPGTALQAKESTKLPDVTTDGLELVKGSKLAIVYVLPDVDFSEYDKVMLLDAKVAFRKNWLRDQNRGSKTRRISSRDVEKIKAEVAELFNQVFTEELTEGGYELVDETEEDVLLVRPQIIDLDVYAPNTLRTSSSIQYAESAGNMTLHLELYDSVSGAVIARALDLQADRERGHLDWQTKSANRAAAEKMIKTWAVVLRTALDETRSSSNSD